MTFPTLDTITDRDTYLDYRVAWKAAYKALSSEIRALKIKTKTFMRQNTSTEWEQNELRRLSDWATEKLIELAEARDMARAATKARKLAA